MKTSLFLVPMMYSLDGTVAKVEDEVLEDAFEDEEDESIAKPEKPIYM